MESAATPHKSEVRKTPLNALHRRLGAKMVNFDSWDMPVEYPSSGGLVAEHKAVRGSGGVFDVSHLGDIRIRSGGEPRGGPGAGGATHTETQAETAHRPRAQSA